MHMMLRLGLVTSSVRIWCVVFKSFLRFPFPGIRSGSVEWYNGQNT